MITLRTQHCHESVSRDRMAHTWRARVVLAARSSLVPERTRAEGSVALTEHQLRGDEWLRDTVLHAYLYALAKRSGRAPLAHRSPTRSSTSQNRTVDLASGPSGFSPLLWENERNFIGSYGRSLRRVSARRNVATLLRSAAVTLCDRVSPTGSRDRRRIMHDTRSSLVDPASSHMLVSKIKPCMSQCMPN